MALWDDIIKPATLTVFAREIVDRYDGDGLLADIFPNVGVDDVVFEWNQGERLNEVAEYRAFDTETPIGDQAGEGTRIAKLAPVGLKKLFGEYEQIRKSARNSPETVQAAAERKAAEVAKATVNRVALLRGEALATGRLAINENEFKQTVDFGRRADFTVTAANPWGGASPDPLSDIEQWVTAYSDANGEAPDRLIMSRKAAVALTKAIYAGLTNPGPVFTQSNASEILVGNGFPPITVNDRQFAGRRLIPDNVAVLASTNGAGATPWGTTVEATDPRYKMPANVELPGLVVGAYDQDDPNVKWIRANAIALPILGNPDLTLAATVL
ncbi:major capsid protein E [Brevibacterium sanguinis]|uniref:Major capsid protein E n=2 Tax=Brevibacterium TaxID=1696 RepID=A0A366IKW9_9MICO|nr:MULTISPECIES: major capsid protein [Brevibacterium]RBP66432.1 major capsid protein E [Brevibacterium sanguinis]RBP73084.1 major capsid protein E [Brevibacterium celere]